MYVLRILVFSLVCGVATGFANLTIHITQGVDKPYPIAIVPFQAQPTETPTLPHGFTQVIKDDLANSGRFITLPDAQLPQRVHTVDQFDWAAWQKIKANADYVLIGKVRLKENGCYDVSFALLTLYAKRPLIRQLFNDIPATQLRSLAHHISDLAYRAITGQRGIFSTKLAYVDVINSDDRAAIYRLIVSDVDGFSPHVLLKQIGIPIAAPTWSHDGKRLAYMTYINNRMAIYAIDLATGKRTLIANYPGINSAPAFAPDDKKMLMALSMGSGSNTNIYMLDFDTKKLTQLTHFANNTSPTWHPNSERIVFNSNRGGTPQLYELNLKTHQVTRLTYQGVQNFRPEFTPDGETIVFMHQARSGGPIRIAQMNLATGVISVISQGALDKSPAVSPNGQMVIYAQYVQNKGVLAEVSIDGKVHLSLPGTEGAVQSPAWSPFL